MSTLVVGRRCPSTASPLYGQHPILSLPSALRAPTLFSLAPAVLIGSCHRWKPVVTNARRLDAASDDERWVTFDGEEEWDRQGSAMQPSGRFLQQGFRAVGIVTDKLTDAVLQIAPEDAPPGTVRAAVVGGLILMSLSFVKGILSFFITLGTVVFGAFVAVRIFGLDVTGSSMDRPTRRGPRGSSRGEGRRRSPGRRGESPTGVKGLLSGVLGNGDSSTEDEGLLDVWFEPKPGRDSRRAR